MRASEDIRLLSEELARDPASLVFLELGEALRRRGDLEVARKVALRGLERHSHNADAHDLLARIFVDSGDLERAFDEWDMTLRLAPGHPGAQKGLGFVCFQQGRLDEAERYLAAAAEADPADQRNLAALAHVRAARGAEAAPAPRATRPVRAAGVEPASATPDAPTAAVPSPASATSGGASSSAIEARTLFADVVRQDEGIAILLDADGLVLAGTYVVRDGRDVAQEVGAGLGGVSEEAERAMRHLGMGNWNSIVFETERAAVAMTPAPERGLVLVAAAPGTPLGLVRRMLDRARAKAIRFMEGLS